MRMGKYERGEARSRATEKAMGVGFAANVQSKGR